MKIDKRIPITEPKPGAKTKYPFKHMNVGDSFFIEPYSSVLQKNVLNAASMFAKYNGTKHKFSTRKEGNGLRVWRVV